MPSASELRSAWGPTIAGLNAPHSSHCGRDIGAEIAALNELDIHDLRIRWRRLFRKPAPPHLPRYLLLRIVAYKLQANAFGDLDRGTAKYLDCVAQDWRERGEKGERRSLKAGPPPVPAVPVRKRSLKPGTILAREHDGVLHRVVVMESGFAWNGTTYKSLSEIARAITGTNWNGPRFFGLRDGEKTRRSEARRVSA
jgi:hypothetical protein